MKYNHQLLNLAQEYVFLPVARKRSGPRGVEQITVPSLSQDGQTLIPTFTSEDQFSQWSQGRFNCVSLLGADIAAAIPRGSGVVVDPGTPNSFILTAEALEDLSTLDVGPEDQSNEALSPSENAELQKALLELFAQYPFVSEAYLVAGDGATADYLLGVHYRSVSPGQRFELLTAIAEIASSQLGSIGAIEVYDDLYLSHSSSWELFSAYTPIYSSVGSEQSASDSSLATTKPRLSRIFMRGQ